MPASAPSLPPVIERLQHAWNTHDLEAFVACFAPNYQSVQPCRPDRKIRVRDQVRKIWSIMFTEVPDFRSDLLGFATQGDETWVELHWYWMDADGVQVDLWGVMRFQIQDDCLQSARVYLESILPPVPWAGDAIE